MIHNRYRSDAPSGENTVVDDEVALLRAAGFDVTTLLAESDHIDGFGAMERASLVIQPIHSRRSLQRFDQHVASNRPDVVHVHNLYPLISPAVIRRAKHHRLPVVASIHNQRMACANGLFFRDGHICTQCSGRRIAWPAVAHSCYRDSMAQSAVMATSMAVHRSTWRKVDRFFVLHEFAAHRLRELGIPEARIRIKHNMVTDSGPPSPPGDGFLFAARLDRAKGILSLLDAWELSGLDSQTTLTVAGDGPLAGEVRERAARMKGVRLVGRISRSEVLEILDGVRAVAVPSISFEGSPLVIAEAMARGRPAVVHDVGGLASLVDPDRGWVSSPSAPALAETLLRAHRCTPERLLEMSTLCRAFYEEHHAPPAVARRLHELYADAIRD